MYRSARSIAVQIKIKLCRQFVPLSLGVTITTSAILTGCAIGSVSSTVSDHPYTSAFNDDKIRHAVQNGCAFYNNPIVASTDDGSIFYCGILDTESVRYAISILDNPAGEIRIASSGGLNAAAVALGEFIFDSGTGVGVEGVCLSGCAHFIAMPAHRIRFSKMGLLGFHNTASSAEAIASSMTFSVNIASLGALSLREQKLYANAGIAASFLFEPQKFVETVCADPGNALAGTVPAEIDIGSVYDIWVPRPGQLVRYTNGPLNSYGAQIRTARRIFSSQLPNLMETPKIASYQHSLREVPPITGSLPSCQKMNIR